MHVVTRVIAATATVVLAGVAIWQFKKLLDRNARDIAEQRSYADYEPEVTVSNLDDLVESPEEAVTFFEVIREELQALELSNQWMNGRKEYMIPADFTAIQEGSWSVNLRDQDGILIRSKLTCFIIYKDTAGLRVVSNSKSIETELEDVSYSKFIINWLKRVDDQLTAEASVAPTQE